MRRTIRAPRAKRLPVYLSTSPEGQRWATEMRLRAAIRAARRVLFTAERALLDALPAHVVVQLTAATRGGAL